MQALLRFTKRHPWLTNVTVYGSLFSCADVVQQKLTKDPGDPIDFTQTAKVGLVGFCFHANFNFFWLRAIERVFPGSAPRNVIRKVVCDQLMAAPITICVFYAGLSFLDGEEDILKNLREKFWPTYKTGVLCWTLIQTVNFSLVPPYIRTAYIGLCAFLWTTFLCYIRKRDMEQATSQLLAFLPRLGGRRAPGAEGQDNRRPSD
ncbi:mpv17-like protein [Rhinatrema bivittatum]|uniref:mpv17-like protein n=1 Tax=Rhinatrema bivittatum TaxID=194408 RepID=UPI00112ACE26|nr:mpv17-like protein [Rhinatrema bivittatum]XP_029441171.1 mpv17-like protein [Rhinatrema bivittatum]XP_029441172.1 mpv17-like protein [Rhinatrema bivittatum]XP_029441173.1 mpv17-like protein [Rhinatrema bivittatum]XP_029441174.1 mpv17-like protein [Rhinatrema bivittatum]XP_029441175.1 mpv17-like protein [Rhinatrema bivittatum]